MHWHPNVPVLNVGARAFAPSSDPATSLPEAAPAGLAYRAPAPPNAIDALSHLDYVIRTLVRGDEVQRRLGQMHAAMMLVHNLNALLPSTTHALAWLKSVSEEHAGLREAVRRLDHVRAVLSASASMRRMDEELAAGQLLLRELDEMKRAAQVTLMLLQDRSVLS
jgi:hypothetical protein